MSWCSWYTPYPCLVVLTANRLPRSETAMTIEVSSGTVIGGATAIFLLTQLRLFPGYRWPTDVSLTSSWD